MTDFMKCIGTLNDYGLPYRVLVTDKLLAVRYNECKGDSDYSEEVYSPNGDMLFAVDIIDGRAMYTQAQNGVYVREDEVGYLTYIISRAHKRIAEIGEPTDYCEQMEYDKLVDMHDRAVGRLNEILEGGLN